MKTSIETSKLEQNFRESPKKFKQQAKQIQDDAFKASYAEKKHDQSCIVFATFGECAKMQGATDCTPCEFYQKHMETLKALQDPKEVLRRYNNWVAFRHGYTPSNDKRTKSTDKKGHTVEVERYY